MHQWQKKKKKDKVLFIVLYIYYLIEFKTNIKDTKVWLDLGSEVNAMTSAYILRLDFRICHSDMSAQKIDEFTPTTLEMVVASF